MDNIKVYKPAGQPSQVEAFIEGLEPKLRDKLVWQIFRLFCTPSRSASPGIPCRRWSVF